MGTGVPTTYLAEEALKALFNVEDLALIESTSVTIWGTKLAINRSIGDWQGEMISSLECFICTS